MLLIFFLVTTSMDVDKGLMRQLPAPEPKKEQPATLVDKSLLMALQVTADGKLLLNDSTCQPTRLQEEAKAFILSKGKQHIISIACDREADYDLYFQVQNSLKQAYSQAWNEASRKQYGKPFAQLDKAHRGIILERYPQRIAESYANAMATDGQQMSADEKEETNIAKPAFSDNGKSKQTSDSKQTKTNTYQLKKGGRP